MVEDLTDASEMVDTDLAEDMNGIIPEEPQEFRHATSLDSALQHLIPTLQSNQGLFILYSEPAVIDYLVAGLQNIMSIGNCRNLRGLGNSMAVFRLYEKLRY